MMLTLAPALELEALVQRVRAEFVEMPGLCLTLPQASRLWGLECGACEMIIQTLIAASFLRRTPNGSVIRCEH